MARGYSQEDKLTWSPALRPGVPGSSTQLIVLLGSQDPVLDTFQRCRCCIWDSSPCLPGSCRLRGTSEHRGGIARFHNVDKCSQVALNTAWKRGGFSSGADVEKGLPGSETASAGCEAVGPGHAVVTPRGFTWPEELGTRAR